MRAPHVAKLSSKFSLTIPKALRQARRWRVGQEFALIPKGTGVSLMPVPRVSDLAGIVRGAKVTRFRDRGDRV
jgi:bifunctional DNA-binding transcriptional regulator/antitoxin component of YhaV-PrlF toxin-antitoxin module